MSVTPSHQELQTANHGSVSVRVLQKCHFKLRKELNVPSLLPYLNQYRLITADFHEELTLQATHAAKVDKLVAELPRSGTDFLERFIQCLRQSVEEEPATSHGQIAEALEEELKLQITRGFACSTQITLAGIQYEEASPNTPLLVGTGQPDQVNKGQKPTKKMHCCSRRWCCYYTTVFVIIVLLALALIILSQEPHISPSVHPHYVVRNSTVELLLDYMPWLDHIALAMDKNCAAKLYQIQDQDCRTLPTLNTSYVYPYDQADFIYMLPGSIIHFTVNPDTHGEVWVFSDYYTANEFGKDPSHFDCHSFPPGAYCFEAEDHPGKYPYYIQQPAYYFIRPHLLNGAIVDWYFNRTIYDRDAIMKYPNIGLLTQVPRTIYFSFPYKKSCILVDIPALSSCYSGTMLATNAVRQEEYLIYPAIPLVICVILLVGVYVFCHLRKNLSFSFVK